MARGTTDWLELNGAPMKDSAADAPIATEAAATQFENQKDQATRKAIVGPNSFSMLA